MKLAITGHRPNKFGNEYDLNGPITSRLKTQIVEIVKAQEATTLITGMALGVDTLFALIGIELGLPIIAAVPFLKQECMWPTKSQELYHKILGNKLVTRYVICSGDYESWKMQKRNQWMVDNCDKLIAVWDGTSGGTANCVNYAKQVNRIILRINPNEQNLEIL